MADPLRAIEEAIGDVDNLRRYLAKKRERQVRSEDERAVVKAIVGTWFRT